MVLFIALPIASVVVQSLFDKTGAIIGRYRDTLLPDHANHQHGVEFQNLEKSYSSSVHHDARECISLCICSDEGIRCLAFAFCLGRAFLQEKLK